MNEPDELQRFIALAISISDGLPVDWQNVEDITTSEKERLLVQELKLLARLARLHRSGGLNGATGPSNGGEVSPASTQRTGEEQPDKTAQARGRDAIGPISWGRLEIRGLIGAGAFGDVYRAWDPRLDIVVALKLFKRSERGHSRMSVEEGRLLALVRHPNVLRVYGADSIEGKVGLWMDYVQGHTLEEILEEQGMLGPKEAALIGLDLCSALAAVHRTGLVHRDLKARNVMREQGGRVVLMDFGSACNFPAEGEEPHDISGTPLYMAPELFHGEEATVRSDLYSLGVLLYHLVTGSYPLVAGSIQELRHAHELGQRRLLRDERPDLPDGFVGIVERCLAACPNDRFASAGEMEQALKSVLGTTQSGHPLDYTNRSPKERVSKLPMRVNRIAPEVLVPHRRSPHEMADELSSDSEQPSRDPETSSVSSYGAASLVTSSTRRRIWAFVGALVLAAILLGVLWMKQRSWGADPHTVLVLPMEIRGQTEGANYVGRAFSEAIAVNLAQVGALTVLPVPTNPLHGGGSLEPVMAARSAGAGRVVTGGILRDGKTLQASISLMDASRNRILWGTQRTVSDELLTNLAISLAEDVAAALEAGLPKRYEYFLYLTGVPAMAASADFGEALGSVRRLDAPAAVAATQRLIQAFPNEPDAHLLHTAALFMDTWEVRQDSAKRRAFEESAAALQRIDPQNPWVEHFRAMFAGRDGRASELIHRLSQILTRQDLTPAARANILSIRSQWQAIVGDREDAVAGLEEALRLNPTDDLNLCITGGALLQMDRREEALIRARQAVALNPSSFQNQFLLGDCLYHLGLWEESTVPLTKASVLRRSQMNCAYLALSLQRAGRASEARAQATAALALPESDWGAYSLAAYHAVAGNRDEALRLLRGSLELWPVVTENLVKGLMDDPDFASLRNEPKFKAIVEEMKKRVRKD